MRCKTGLFILILCKLFGKDNNYLERCLLYFDFITLYIIALLSGVEFFFANLN
jgi:hypothetical protein